MQYFNSFVTSEFHQEQAVHQDSFKKELLHSGKIDKRLQHSNHLVKGRWPQPMMPPERLIAYMPCFLRIWQAASLLAPLRQYTKQVSPLLKSPRRPQMSPKGTWMELGMCPLLHQPSVLTSTIWNLGLLAFFLIMSSAWDALALILYYQYLFYRENHLDLQLGQPTTARDFPWNFSGDDLQLSKKTEVLSYHTPCIMHQ